MGLDREHEMAVQSKLKLECTLDLTCLGRAAWSGRRWLSGPDGSGGWCNGGLVVDTTPVCQEVYAKLARIQYSERGREIARDAAADG